MQLPELSTSMVESKQPKTRIFKLFGAVPKWILKSKMDFEPIALRTRTQLRTHTQLRKEQQWEKGSYRSNLSQAFYFWNLAVKEINKERSTGVPNPKWRHNRHIARHHLRRSRDIFFYTIDLTPIQSPTSS